MWFIFALMGAILNAVYHTLIKKYLKSLDQYVLASGVYLSSFLILFLFSIFKGIPQIGPGFSSSVFATSSLNVIAIILYFKALKITDLSLVTPITSFTPVFLILTSFILLKEVPSTMGLLGIFLIVIGSYILNTSKNNKSILTPFKRFAKNKGLQYMLIVAFIYSITSSFDKIVMLNSDSIFGSAIICLLLGLSFLIISLIKKIQIIQIYKKHFLQFIAIGTIFAFILITINIAYTMQIVTYVISVKRLSILFSVFLGGFIFKENNIVERIVGVLIMLSGTIILAFF